MSSVLSIKNMKWVISIVAILLFAAPAFAETYTAEKVIDAVTLKLANGETVRLIGVDVAEDTGVFVKSLQLEGREVKLEFDVEKEDEKGRWLAYVHVPEFEVVYWSEDDAKYQEENYVRSDGWSASTLFLNATIIKAGYASPKIIPPNTRHADFFKKLSQEAKENKRGLWGSTQTPQYEVRYALAQNKLNQLSTACEVYADDHSGQYPINISFLVDSEPPYTYHLPCGKIIKGFAYTCSSDITGYTLSATSVVGKGLKETNYLISTGGINNWDD